MSHEPSWLTFLGVVVVAAPLLLTLLLGVSSLLDRKLAEDTTTRAVQVAVISGLLAAVAILIAMLAMGTRHVTIEPGELGRDPPALPLLDQAPLRPAVGPDGHPVVHPGGHDRRVRQQVPPSRARLQPLLRALCPVPAGDGGRLAGRDDRDPVHRLGAGRALLGTAGRLLPGTSRAGPERPVGLDQLPGLGRRRSCWPRWPCTTCGARATSTSSWARRPGPRPTPACPRTGLRRGRAAPGGGGRQIGLDPLLGLAAACHGGPDALQRRLLRGPVRTPGDVPAAPDQPHPRKLDPGCRPWSWPWD